MFSPPVSTKDVIQEATYTCISLLLSLYFIWKALGCYLVWLSQAQTNYMPPVFLIMQIFWMMIRQSSSYLLQMPRFSRQWISGLALQAFPVGQQQHNQKPISLDGWMPLSKNIVLGVDIFAKDANDMKIDGHYVGLRGGGGKGKVVAFLTHPDIDAWKIAMRQHIPPPPQSCGDPWEWEGPHTP